MSGECDDCGEHAVECSCNKESPMLFFTKSKVFEKFEDMIEFEKAWRDMPLDLEWFETELYHRYMEAKTNKECHGDVFTNRMACQLLRMATDWVNYE